MHLENDVGGCEINIQGIGSGRFGYGRAVRPPENGVGKVLAVGRIDHQIVWLTGGAKGALDLSVIIGGDDQQWFGDFRQKTVEGRNGGVGDGF